MSELKVRLNVSAGLIPFLEQNLRQDHETVETNRFSFLFANV